MEELTRLRTDRGWSQQRLANEADVDKATVNQIERGRRSPNVETLEKLADALGVGVADFFPKAQAPLPFEDKQRRSIPEALSSYMSRRIGSLIAELNDKNSPHFLNSTAATNWVTGIRQEAKDWADWAVEEASVLMPELSNREVYDVVIAPLLSLDAIVRRAEKRIDKMKKPPANVARIGFEKVSREAQESQRRLHELRAVS